MNSWTKRAIGVAALAGGLLALGAGTASADEASTRASVRVGSAPTVAVRLCGGAALSGLLGRCGGQAGSGSDGTTVRAGVANVRVRVAGLGSARGSLETRSGRPRAAVSGQARIIRPAGLAPSVAADVAADTSPRAKVAVEVAAPPAGPLGPVPALPAATVKVAIMLAREGTADGADVAATVDLAVPPATADAAVALGPLGAADEPAATVDATLAVGLPGLGVPELDAVAPPPTLPTPPAPVGDIRLDDLLGAVGAPLPGVGGLVPPTSAAACIGDCDAATGNGPGTGGTPTSTQPSPTQPPADGTGGQDTSTGGITAPDQSGLTGTGGMLAGAARATGAALAKLRSALGGSGGTLAFTGGAANLLAFMALGLLLAGALLLRAARPAPVAERR